MISLTTPDNAYYQVPADIADSEITDNTTLPDRYVIEDVIVQRDLFSELALVLNKKCTGDVKQTPPTGAAV